MIEDTFLESAIQQFREYKTLADKTFHQLQENDFYYRPNETSNSLAIIIQHMHGNMLSRWTNFLTEDGEKEWRRRDAEFEEQRLTKQGLLKLWEEGWAVLFNALTQLRIEDLDETIYIRTKPLSVVQAIQRQLTHYASHVGQIIFIGKMILGADWKFLSIAKGESKAFNENMGHS